MDSKKIQTSYKAIVQTIKPQNSQPPQPKKHNQYKSLVANEAKAKSFTKIAGVPQCGAKLGKTFSNFQ